MVRLIAILTVMGSIGALIFGFNPGDKDASSTRTTSSMHAYGTDYTYTFYITSNHLRYSTISCNKTLDKN